MWIKSERTMKDEYIIIAIIAIIFLILCPMFYYAHQDRVNSIREIKAMDCYSLKVYLADNPYASTLQVLAEAQYTWECEK